jgi:hypothetical protein
MKIFGGRIGYNIYKNIQVKNVSAQVLKGLALVISMYPLGFNRFLYKFI